MIDEPTSEPEPIEVGTSAVAQEDPPPAVPDQCNDETWAALLAFITRVTANTFYGPGRGLWEEDRFLVTYAAGRRSKPTDLGIWPNTRNALYWALHCTSLTNMALAWLTRLNQDYTHAGTIPELFDLCSKVGMQVVPHDGWTLRYRGYGEHCYEIESNGSTAARVKSLIDGRPYIDAMELYERRAELPSVVVFGQSSLVGRNPNGSPIWNEWHHTGLFLFREGRMYRCAADGYAAKGVFSASPMGWTEITMENIGSLDLCRYRVYGVRTNGDGSYGDQSRPIAEVDFEAF